MSPDVIKLGFRFKQDLVYLSSTFREQGCDAGFDRVSLSSVVIFFRYFIPSSLDTAFRYQAPSVNAV